MFGTGASHNIAHNISKNWMQGIYGFWVRFFTFLFFMLELSRIRLCEYNKSCSTLHHEFKKIEFAFFWIFYDFLQILQESAKSFHYWRCTFAPGPLELFKVSQMYPRLHKTPRKDLGACNATLGHGGRRGSGQFRRAGGTPGLESGRARLGAHLGRRVVGVWAEGSPMGTRGGDWRWQPRRLGVTARRALGWAMRDPGRCNGSQGREWDGWPAAGESGAASSPEAAAMAVCGSGGAPRGVAVFK
jgi:hypothetical protein